MIPLAKRVSVAVRASIHEFPATQWNALVEDNNPFLRHEFLAALEDCRCLGEDYGWIPRYLGVFEAQHLIGAMPLYEKHHSWGEFVFDHAWAEAYQRQGLAYYPKLVAAIPYSPVSGQRLLAAEHHRGQVFSLLLAAAKDLAHDRYASGFHCLFPKPYELDWLASQSLYIRHDCQFHWHNRNYTSFDDFLDALSAKKRKNIRQERKRVQQAGVQLRVLSGHDASEADWQCFTELYRSTFEKKWGVPTLNRAFFQRVAAQLPDQVILVLADRNGECVAGSLMYRSDKVLYGRYWGCHQAIDCLHFEACYYQGIDYCIKNAVQTFEPGAQGEHKVARGFIPTLTRSSHWLKDDYFKSAIQRFIEHEQDSVSQYIRAVEQHLPYKRQSLK